MPVYPKTRFAWERECFASHLTHIIMHPGPWGFSEKPDGVQPLRHDLNG